MDIPQLIDGDSKFIGVVNRLDKHNLPEGYVASATNRTFERSVIKNRWGVIRPSWGGKFGVTFRTVTASSTDVNVSVVDGDQIPNNTQIYSDPGKSYVYSATIVNGGSGFSDGGPYDVIFTGGGGSGASATFTVSGGEIDSVMIVDTGVGYTSTPTLDFSDGGAGSGESVTLTMKSHLIYANGTYCISDDGATVELSSRSLDWDNEADLYFFNGLVAMDDIVGMLVYREPILGVDVILVASNEVREDGGQGAVYVFNPNQSNTSILLGASEVTVPMNGHDFYGQVNFIQCADGVMLLRSGLPRYYFTGSADHLDDTANTITLNVDATFIETGTKIKFVGLTEGHENIADAVSGTTYFARVVSSPGAVTEVALYDTEAHANASPSTTGRVDLDATDASYRYYLLPVDPKSFYTHQQETNITSETPNIDSPPLIMQSSQAVASPLSNGFLPLERSAIQSADSTTNVFTSENHRLVPGDSINLRDITGLTGFNEDDTYYARPIDPDTFYLYDNVDDSLSESSTPLTVADTGTALILKSGISGSNMPNCRDGIYFGNRVFGIFGPDYGAFSDVLNPTVYLPLINEFRLNSGTNDRVVGIYPFNETTIVIMKQKSVLALVNVAHDLSSLRLVEITRDYGCVAPKSITSTGSDIVWLSQRGVVSLKQTEFGLTQSVVVPLSDSISKTIEKIDWGHIDKACATYFDNRYILSFPSSNGGGANDSTIVYNFLNESWDGEWTGEYLKPRFYGRIYIGGQIRLIFADDSGYIHYFDPLAYQDRTYDGSESVIQTELLTRAYTCGTREHKQWTNANLSIATWDPTYSIDAIFDNDNLILELRDTTTKSRSQYYTYGVDDYDATNVNDDFNEPNREDYSVTTGFITGENGISFGVKQTTLEKTRPTGHSSGIQIKVTSESGLVDINSISIAGIPFRVSGRTDS